ncbi:MAG: GGDEF domain-containing protein [Clostridiales Family XIII bacterium]|jgi:diguanylate cyclase (GGDEF)-like protein|nr:GGDEF domain-containing protein [Clostridiales Family XIII bacterium]
MDPVAEYLFEYLRDVLYDPARANMDLERLPEDFKEFGQGLEFFTECVSEVRTFAKFLAKGELNCPAPSLDNELAAPLKALHATLKHLTWQTQQVAKGDYHQHVDYLGEFAVAFNTMTKQLEQRHVALAREIELSRQKTRALEQSNDLFEMVTRDSEQWIAVVERDTGEWLFYNYPVTQILAAEDFLPQLKRWMSAEINETEGSASSRTAEIEMADNGMAQYFSAIIRPIIWREKPSVVFVLSDVSAARAHIRELENTAYRDTLTRQYNRHFGMRLLDQWTTEKRSFMLCFVDIDNLKYVNDKFGHNEGDKYILSVTAVLRGFSPDITICRLGGDEFMLLAEGWDEERANKHLESLRMRLLKRNEDPDAQYFHSMSYGVVAVSGDNTLSPSELLAKADEMMYHYKRAHKLERAPGTEES